MTTVVPRWEWRTFGHRFPTAEKAFGRLKSVDTVDSDELYLLTSAGDNVKVRDDLMDIKVLREVGDDGLERWEPTMKASFPLAPEDVAGVVAALRLEALAEPLSDTSLAGFLSTVVEPSGTVRAIEVHKHRVRYRIGACMSEVSDVSAGGRTSRTIAIESEDRAAVLAAIDQVGLAGYANVSYPRGLVAMIEGHPSRYAVIDVGTNSVKFDVAELDTVGEWRTLLDRAEVTRLGEGLPASGVIAKEPLERTIAAIDEMAREARGLGVVAIAAVGTEGLRQAANGAEAVAEIRRRTGVAVEIIPGEEEARLAYLAVKSGLGLADASLVVFDTGGGSSQFTFGHGDRVDERFSIDVGAVRYTERFGLTQAVGPEVVAQAKEAIATDLARLDGHPTPDLLVGMGGAVTNITAVRHGLAHYDPDVVQGTVLDRAEIERQIELYRSRDADGRRAIVGLQPKRAEVILAGACIVATIMARLGMATMTVSDRALRHGLMAERFGQR